MTARATKNHKKLYQLRRLAVQLAEQLPEEQEDALIALQFAAELVKDFLGKDGLPSENARAAIALVR